ncbi:hypothetical protein [Peribacillus butanolivorans]|uniref:hypothetical protein n=1 Tax=Peribacillus butanolivorans TaxID=421767 RepID=UPI003672B4D4
MDGDKKYQITPITATVKDLTALETPTFAKTSSCQFVLGKIEEKVKMRVKAGYKVLLKATEDKKETDKVTLKIKENSKLSVGAIDKTGNAKR